MDNGYAHKRVLILEDEDQLRMVYQHRLVRKGYHVKGVSSAEEALKLIEQESFDVALVDIRMEGMDGLTFLDRVKSQDASPEVIMITGYGSIDSAIKAMKSGAYDYLTKPCKLPELEIVVQRAYEKALIERENARLREELSIKDPSEDMIYQSRVMISLMGQIGKVAAADSSVIIEGESGVGKEIVARTIHRNSPRCSQAFIAINCSNLQENLLESELFGHEQGAFSGATKKKRGLIELASYGTLFVDEVTEMKPNVQAKLLRILENHCFRRVGGNREIRVDIRIIAATNKSLPDRVADGSFREDLFFRLNVITLHVPPLRERKEDIPLLLEHFLKKKGRQLKMGKTISHECLDLLSAYSWPGNVRELSNAVERAMILSQGDVLKPRDFGFLRSERASIPLLSLKALEKDHILKVLRQVKNNKSHAARILGISSRNLHRKLHDFKIA